MRASTLFLLLAMLELSLIWVLSYGPDAPPVVDAPLNASNQSPHAPPTPFDLAVDLTDKIMKIGLTVSLAGVMVYSLAGLVVR